MILDYPVQYDLLLLVGVPTASTAILFLLLKRFFIRRNTTILLILAWTSIGVLLVLRFITFPITVINGVIQFEWVVVVVAAISTTTAVLAGLSLTPQQQFQQQYHKNSKPHWWHNALVLATLLIIGSVQSLTALGETGLQNDEWYHVETAEGYRQTGQFIWWDFLNQQPRYNETGETLPYLRAFHYTWQVVQSVNWFGWSEESARYPSVLWYLVFIVVVYGMMHWWKKDTRIAALVTLTLLLFDHIILHGRLVRMYSMLLALGTATAWVWIAAYVQSMHGYIRTWKWYGLIIGGIILLAATVMTHTVFLLFPILFSLFLIAELVVQWVQNRAIHPVTGHWVLVCCILGILVTIGIMVTRQYVLFELVGWRTTANIIYEWYLFIDTAFLPLAATMYLCAVWHAFKHTSRDPVARFLAVSSLSVLLLFIFFIKRYDALRYSMVFTPLAVMLLIPLWDKVLQRMSTSVRYKLVPTVMASVLIVLTITPLSWPGVKSNAVFRTSRADMTNANGYGADIRAAYEYIQTHRKPNEAVFAVLFRSYYWKDNSATIVNLGVEQSMTVPQLQQLLARYQQGWLVWSNRKKHHLSPAVREYIEKNTKNMVKRIPELTNTNMSVYYFDVTNTTQ